MTFNQKQQLDTSKDYIVPIRKNNLKTVKDILPIANPDFDGSFSEHLLLYGKNGNRIYLLGLGEDKHDAKLEEAFRKLCVDTQKNWDKSIQIYANDLNDQQIRKAIIGLQLAQYEIGEYKSTKAKAFTSAVSICTSANIDAVLNEGELIGQTINRIKALVDAPPNIKTPEFLAKWSDDSAKSANYKCTVLDEKELESQGFKAVLAVGKGSVNKPVVIFNEYKGRTDKDVDLVLVGKGITFDSGGLSIKPSTNLHYMKSDMGGAAVVLGIIELIAKLHLNVNVTGIVCSAENAVDAASYRPGDVIESYSGKTIEIIDTDAEGRLVMSDGLSYAVKNIKPKYLIDIATLTGSVVRTLGYSAAGMFTHNKEMAQTFSEIGYKVNERVWPLPLFEDFESDLHSDIADIRNFSGKPIAGAINAAKFLEAFTDNHENWMHLDIAGVSFGDSPYAKMKSSSGYGIQLFLEFIKTLESK
ncbi:leucyl aminopeptidase family protein [Winogradskyella luteola]|uniref:Probable cytosol aminopeptidase n=1 Tax=Winogradskyella luteola TaxID=2828330 RepID=A0A9X1JR23_9FLAO|nr:leucyl aminopeptidase family protein [Winogradskyella luteola]MBV7268192.1 leucyl aminopeptidase family protein [Winogradskyella luteola]